MDEVAVDVEQAGAVFLPVNHVIVENLVVEGAQFGLRRGAHVRKSVDFKVWKRKPARPA
jgi:hypothetical protein